MSNPNVAVSAEAGSLVVIGNPLLDISAHVDASFLAKYELQAGTALLAEPKHMPIYSELVATYPVEYIAGGDAQNSSRVAAWLLGQSSRGAVVYIGSIGRDDNGATLRRETERFGVTTHYQETDAAPTGTCAVLIVDKERCLCTNLGAANLYKLEHLQSAEISAVYHNARYFYSSGYFITVSTESLVTLGKHAAETNKPFLFNLAAPFIIDFFTEQLKTVLTYVDVVFANEHEAEALGVKMGWGTDLPEIAKQLSEFSKVNTARSRTVIFTQGARSTVVFADGKSTEYHPLRVDPKEIVDTNGAGDSFVGGFLASYILGKPIDHSVAAGHYAASEVIKRSGCTFPDTPNFAL